MSECAGVTVPEGAVGGAHRYSKLYMQKNHSFGGDSRSFGFSPVVCAPPHAVL